VSEPTPEQLAQVEAWIRAEARAKSVDEVQSYVVSRVAKLAGAARAVPEDALAIVPAGQEWAPIETLRHVTEWTAQCGEDVLHVCLTGERPGNPLPQFEPDRESLLAKLNETLESVRAHVTAADPDAFLETTWEHPFFGRLNWREWHLFLGVHATDHANQLKELNEALVG
jgi:hypothetical protein